LERDYSLPKDRKRGLKRKGEKKEGEWEKAFLLNLGRTLRDEEKHGKRGLSFLL